jgi:hypothetical protein
MINIIKFKFYYLLRKINNIILVKPKIKNTKETINHIVNHKKSIVRFGDGEFDLILKNRSLGFQNKNDILRDKLLHILENNDDSILVCIPFTILDRKHLNNNALKFWDLYCNRYYKDLKSYFNLNSIYYDSLFTRLYIY